MWVPPLSLQQAYGVSSPEAAEEALLAAEARNYKVFVHVNNISADVEGLEDTVAALRNRVEALRGKARRVEKEAQT